ncbi:MAG: ClpXP protease specificity-enhancing factor [Coxiella sp. RIFCSPHIGHO2_12_FULL_44_14]|nr:MAG: ClpXP protease specificity-enhancing factor [Coxiella sp. RIFCSPHIGHO2_12_FULL_44_14]
MNSSKPYLLRAVYEWLTDNQLTPYIMVDVLFPGVEVPERFVEDGKIILNIEDHAVKHLSLGNDIVEFDARFSGISHHIHIPVPAIKAVYAFENGRGMVFSDEGQDEGSGPSTGGGKPPSPTKPKRGKPHLTVVK